jgi:hypothetical protein
MSVLDFLSHPGRLAIMIPIVLIVSGAITTIVKRVIVHRERMALIEMGLHPDYPPEEGSQVSQHSHVG